MPAEGAPSAGPALVEEGKLDDRIKIKPREAPHAPPAEGEESSPQETEKPPLNGEAEAKPGDIQFYADGTADAREILLRDSMGFELLLRINPITGRVRIITSKPEPEAQP